MRRSIIYITILAVACILLGVIIGVVAEKKYHIRLPKAVRTCLYRGKIIPQLQKQRAGLMTHNILKHFDEKLSLNSEQKDAIRNILEQTKEEIIKSQGEFKDRVLEIKQETSLKIQELLDSQQKEKFQQLSENYLGKTPKND